MKSKQQLFSEIDIAPQKAVDVPRRLKLIWMATSCGSPEK
jgi:hypothetical protein